MKTLLSVTLALIMCESPALAQQRTYNTSKALLEVNDPKAQRNPVRSVPAAAWKAGEVQSRLKPKAGQDVAVVCEGKFPAGYIADDLYRQSGGFNRSFAVGTGTTIMDLCHQMEDTMRRQNPSLVK